MFDQEDDDIDYDDVTTPSSKELNETPLETFNRVEKILHLLGIWLVKLIK